MKTESNEIMDHIRKTILITSFLHDLETIANEILKENITLKNYILAQITLNTCVYHNKFWK